ncbi:MAG: AlpA family phage regulatory protein [Betaproteobacteria bacterium]|nr:AlpA family phage regulatory protein [Betaproteobacteria bacterium]MBP6189205.1 AlpA family phage regulatory protein [Azonexus sp.]MBP6203268.1 AlpA family phage regulatory protein [Azonexus sp.]
MSQATQGQRRVLRIKEVCERTGLSRSGIYDRLNPESKYYAPDFPKRFKLGVHSVGWDSTEIDRWIAERKERGVVGSEH